MRQFLTWFKTLSSADLVAIIVPLFTSVIIATMFFSGMINDPKKPVRVKGQTIVRPDAKKTADADKTHKGGTAEPNGAINNAPGGVNSKPGSSNLNNNISTNGVKQKGNTGPKNKAPSVNSSQVPVSSQNNQTNSSEAPASSTPEDNSAPELTVLLTPGVLPPNQQMVEIEASISVTDDNDPEPVVVLTSIKSSDPDDAEGDGDGVTKNDIQEADFGAADFNFFLRAETSGTGSDRIYTVTYTATDASGNSAQVSGNVLVPHDQQKDIIYLPL